MTANERAAEVANLAREVAAAMATFPRLNANDQLSLVLGANITLERLERAFVELLATMRKDANS